MRKNSIIKRTAVFTMAAVLGITGIRATTVYAGENKTAGEYIYCVGSVSKVYVTAAAMHLKDEGKLNIDAPVTDYIPEFKMADERYKDITVRMLMDHTSGIMGTTTPGSFLYNDNNMLHHDTLLQELSTQRLKADPGAYAAYCNDGFDLLEIVIERVSGMSYTDYVEQTIAKPAGCKHTGTAVNMLQNIDLVPAFTAAGTLNEQGMTMCIGAGGVYATASDMADFGSLFFKGEQKLLSEDSKCEMAKRWTSDADAYLDASGLGWDIVSMPKYEAKGVSVQYKGGDTGMNHALLMTAPEEEISVAVLSNGGTSAYNGSMAEALMDVVLKDRGIMVQEEEEQVCKTLTEIPEEYDRFAGYYAIQNDMGGGAMISRVTFPDHRYMHVENHSATRTTVQDFLLCEDQTFAELAFEVENGDLSSAKVATDPLMVSFAEKDGTVYLAEKNRQRAPGLGSFLRSTYAGQRLDENPVSEEILNKWRGLEGKKYLLANDLYSAQAYSEGITQVYLSDVVPGYLYAVTFMGSRLLKITDETHAIAPFTIPSSTNRDLIEITIEDGEEIGSFTLSTGLKYLSSDTLQELNAPGSFAPHDREPIWYRIGDEIANRSFRLIEKPENSAVVVFNRYGKSVFDSHVCNAGEEIPLPRDGYILFTGKTGDVIALE